MNLFKRFERLVSQPPLRVATVLSIHGTAALLQETDGGTTRARFGGNSAPAVGTKIYARAGLIEGPAPNLPLVEIEE